MKYTIHINNTQQQVDVEPETPLLWVIRDSLNLMGTKFGCGIGQCGACTVLIDGQTVRSCNTPINTLASKSVITIEGISKKESLHPVQQAWKSVDVPQCGYCQSGQILSCIALLEKHPKPTDKDIDQAMTNLCRCGTYPEIREAIHLAAQQASGDHHEN